MNIQKSFGIDSHFRNVQIEQKEPKNNEKPINTFVFNKSQKDSKKGLDQHE